MKRTILLLLAGLLLALPTVAQAPEKATLDDLVVTAEIVNHRYQAPKTEIGKPQLVFYAKLVVRNQTNHDRKILTMSCSWEDSWTYEGGFAFGGWICEKNVPTEIVIPVGKALIFYCPLFDCRKTKYFRSGNSRISDFKLGFIDFTNWEDFSTNRRDIIKSRTVYWSNQLNANISVRETPEVAASEQPYYYVLVTSGK